MATFLETGLQIVRVLVNDLSDSPTFDDDRIALSLVVAGLISSQEFKFNTNYTFDVEGVSITPDPLDPNINDMLAVAMWPLKASCILNTNSMEGAIGNAIKIRDGDSEIDTSRSMNGYEFLIKNGPCATYEALKKRQLFLQSMHNGRGVFGPMSSIDFLISGTYGMSQIYSQFGFRR